MAATFVVSLLPLLLSLSIEVSSRLTSFSFLGFASFKSAGECWEWENVADGDGGVTVSYFRCSET